MLAGLRDDGSPENHCSYSSRYSRSWSDDSVAHSLFDWNR